MDFTPDKLLREVVCLWWTSSGKQRLALTFILIPIPHTTLATTMHFTASETPDKTVMWLSPQIFMTGPYAIKCTVQQQVIFNLSWSLKRVGLSMSQLIL